MKESTIVAQLVNEIEAATASDVGVRTVGGDQEVSPDEVIIDWTANRLPDENGHNSFGGYITDNSGNNTGIEHHTYWSFEADCIARSYSEATRDSMLHEVQAAFIPYEKDATAFDRDTREWEVGSAGPRNNAAIEPDWYEAGVLITFDYVKRADETGKDHIETINESVSGDETIEVTHTETK